MADVQRRGRLLSSPSPRGGPLGLSLVRILPLPVPVDREKTCPLLLRVFTKVGGHHNENEFVVRGKEPNDEVQIYTLIDATLRELTDLVKEVAPESRQICLS
ncbi:Histone deacetylase complex subunit SAP18 [Capsicum annuum]|uniref:Histone deacetylase complex subunit SAP18 n=1 Tax=Capsicum annuum TaxID=4072 RepID=A0A2G2ZZK1_CAPAN|nr:Histone deacetylase complex subunit SAP18 [Capsicum annuum]